jgi:hypothetical protein
MNKGGSGFDPLESNPFNTASWIRRSSFWIRQNSCWMRRSSFWYDGIASQYDGIVSEDDKIAARRSSFWIPSFWLQWSFLNPTKNLQVLTCLTKKTGNIAFPNSSPIIWPKNVGAKAGTFRCFTMEDNGGQQVANVASSTPTALRWDWSSPQRVIKSRTTVLKDSVRFWKIEFIQYLHSHH